MVVGWMSLGGGGPLGCLVLHALGYYTLPPLPLLPSGSGPSGTPVPSGCMYPIGYRGVACGPRG